MLHCCCRVRPRTPRDGRLPASSRQQPSGAWRQQPPMPALHWPHAACTVHACCHPALTDCLPPPPACPYRHLLQIHYEGGGSRTPATDVVCPMYARVHQIVALTDEPGKPYRMCPHALAGAVCSLHLSPPPAFPTCCAVLAWAGGRACCRRAPPRRPLRVLAQHGQQHRQHPQVLGGL